MSRRDAIAGFQPRLRPVGCRHAAFDHAAIVSMRMPGSLSAATSPQLEAPDRWALMLRYHGLAEQAEEPRPCTAILGAAQVPAGSEPAETVVLTGAAPNANTRAGRLASDHGRLRLMIA
jgi:hypothetical protein